VNGQVPRTAATPLIGRATYHWFDGAIERPNRGHPRRSACCCEHEPVPLRQGADQHEPAPQGEPVGDFARGDRGELNG
jgi:hypothetical protein